MVEAMVALVLADHYLRQLAIAPPPARRSVRKVARPKQR
jgi:chorismate synthase